MAEGMIVSWAWGSPMSWNEATGPARQLHMEAGPQDLDRLATQFDLEQLKGLKADLLIAPWLDGVQITGVVQGVAVRECGVSLEPFDELVDEPIRVRIVPEGSPNAAKGTGEVIVDLDAEDPPDEAAAAIDVTGYVVEAFALGLSPFPRKPGIEFHAPETPTVTSPFAALAGLTQRGSNT